MSDSRYGASEWDCKYWAENKFFTMSLCFLENDWDGLIGVLAGYCENRKDAQVVCRYAVDFANKKAIENLALAEVLILVGTTRAQYFHDEGDGITFYESHSLWCEIPRE
jgi:hypothetical protein